MYGTETCQCHIALLVRFENDVKMYGTETDTTTCVIISAFENDVKMYGTETYAGWIFPFRGLRMM